MAKTKKEVPVMNNETGSIKVKEKVEKQPDGNETKGDVTKVKEKMKMKPQVMEETITKVDLSEPPKTEEDADTKQEATNVAEDKQTSVVEEVVEKVPQEQDTVQDETTPVVEEITEEEKKEVEDAVNVLAQFRTFPHT